jgi:hypothetical protein
VTQVTTSILRFSCRFLSIAMMAEKKVTCARAMLAAGTHSGGEQSLT